jgi:hypothetical protein
MFALGYRGGLFGLWSKVDGDATGRIAEPIKSSSDSARCVAYAMGVSPPRLVCGLAAL